MKRNLLLILCIVAVTIATAESVTPQQALEQARSFMQRREADGSRPRKAPGKQALQLKMVGEESGLYLFNVSDGEGFVIVSNDDRTAPILGYSDSGTLDPARMPENMRWWLQEYANQIAWMEENGITAKPASQAAAPKRRSHNTATIDPLLSTTWDQVWPYNLQCPPYGSDNCATGCVATAMAQVMKYFEHPASPKKDIAKYTHSYFGDLGPLSSVTFDWTNMLDSYNIVKSESTDTEEAKNAVATLMKYCGYSVQMNYWDSSGTTTNLVATALTEYFDYNATTTQYVSRSFYSYETWRDIIYYELSQNRPVVYGGSAADNGHAFVCDGYKNESSTDLFHINWGWSGSSDGYFVLSVLNPSQQGAGGSPTASAYTFGQEAIIGIQPKDQKGDVLAAAKGPIPIDDLTVNSISVSHSTIAFGESVDVTLNVTNKSSNIYDGDLFVSADGKGLVIGKTFQIPAGTTQNCVITYKPSKAGTYTLRHAYPEETGGHISYYPSPTASLTVEDATPTALTTTAITSQTATFNWTPAGTASKWNLRYRPMNVEKFNGSSLPGGWSTMEWDADPHNWEISTGTGIGGSNCVASASYLGKDLKPHNGLMSPSITLGGSISLYAWGENETFRIWIYTGGEISTIFSEITTTSTPQRYDFDLSYYSGEGNVIINHCNSGGKSAESWLYVDNISIKEPGAIAPWTTIKDITARPYTLTGLDANTDYEAQLQAVFNDGGNWSTGIAFTTPYGLADNDLALTMKNTDWVSKLKGQTVDICLDGRKLYKDGEWNTLCLPFDVTLAGSPLSGGEAKVFDATASSFNAGDRQLTLAFTDAPATVPAGTPFIIKWASGANIVSPVFSGVTVSDASHDAMSTDGKITFTGLTNTLEIASDDMSKLFLSSGNKLYAPKSGIKLGSCRAYFQLNGITMNPTVSSSVKTFVLDFGDGKTTGIRSIEGLQTGDASEAWYTLDGRMLDGKPAQRGVYIRNGRKIVIK